MRVHADFSRRAIVLPEQQVWVASPQGGVARVMLDRVGEEKARATSLVRYQPGTAFPAHPHPGGEEILVLSGTFSDESGDYPAGCYLRNPPGSSHRPLSREGALIFVKLRQMSPDDQDLVRIDTRAPGAWQQDGALTACPLFDSADERVRLLRVPPGAVLPLDARGGSELLVLGGELSCTGIQLPSGAWCRLPPGDSPSLVAATEGASVYLKTGHLQHVRGL